MALSDANAAGWRRILRSDLKSYQIRFDESHIDLLTAYIKELSSANKKLNLTRITDPLQIAESLLLDSIIPGLYISSDSSVLDLGTGAGLPGIPLKIMNPGLSVMLIDAKRKKINFLKYVISVLGLQNIEALHTRAENVKARFDVVISRAVSNLKELVVLGAPLLKPNGVLIAMKGRHYQPEIKNLRSAPAFRPDQCSYTIEDISITVKDYRLPVLKIDRSLVMLRFTP